MTATTEQVWWVVMCKVNFHDVTGFVGATRASIAKSMSEDEPIAFAPIFATKEAAEKWADGAEVLAIRARQDA